MVLSAAEICDSWNENLLLFLVEAPRWAPDYFLAYFLLPEPSYNVAISAQNMVCDFVDVLARMHSPAIFEPIARR